MTTEVKQKPLSKREKNVCESLWGGIPVDVNWVRESKLFQKRMEEYDTFTFKWKWPDLEWYNSLNGTETIEMRSDSPTNTKSFFAPLFKDLKESVYNEERLVDIWKESMKKSYIHINVNIVPVEYGGKHIYVLVDSEKILKDGDLLEWNGELVKYEKDLEPDSIWVDAIKAKRIVIASTEKIGDLPLFNLPEDRIPLMAKVELSHPSEDADMRVNMENQTYSLSPKIENGFVVITKWM